MADGGNSSLSNVTCAALQQAPESSQCFAVNPADDSSGFLFALMAIFAGLVTRSLTRMIPSNISCPPYTVLMFLFGVGFDRWGPTAGILASSMDSWKGTHPNFILFILVPPLLFESSFNVNWGVFRNLIPSSILLAGPGVLFSTVLTALLIKPVIMNWVEFPLECALLLGAISSATDPVAVVAVLKDLGAPARLSMLVEGESLLNDGTAVMLFVVFLQLVKNDNEDETHLTPEFLLWSLARIGGVALAWGLSMAAVTYYWVKAFKDVTIDITVLIIGVFLTFYVAEHVLHVSGILAIVVYGLFLARNKSFAMDAHTAEENAGVWEEAAFLSNTFIFALAGLIISDRTALIDGSGAYIGVSVVLYILCSLVRVLMVVGLFPVMHYLGYGLTSKEATMLTFSGLRGAISLALALLVEQSEDVGRWLCTSDVWCAQLPPPPPPPPRSSCSALPSQPWRSRS